MNFGRVLQFIGMTMLPSALVLGLTQKNGIRDELTLFALGCIIFVIGTLWMRHKS